MENHWQELWNNRTINFDELNVQDEQRLIIELKRIVGWDFKDSAVVADEFKKEYEYLKENLDLSDKIINVGGGGERKNLLLIWTAPLPKSRHFLCLPQSLTLPKR